MQPFAALLDELRDDRIGAGGFQQFDARAAGRQHGDVDLFGVHCFAQAYQKAQLLL